MKTAKTNFLPVMVFWAFLYLFLAMEAMAQSADYEKMQKLKYLDLGITQFDNGMYKDADASFREVLSNVKVLPAEICYYFGANSFYLSKYKQSINWLNKYIALKGTSGQFFENASALLKKAEEKYLTQTDTAQNEVYAPAEDVDFTVMPKVDCGPSGKVICPVCKGQTVIIKRTALRVEYRTCPYCDEHGYLTCEEYNLLLQGELKPKSERIIR